MICSVTKNAFYPIIQFQHFGRIYTGYIIYLKQVVGVQPSFNMMHISRVKCHSLMCWHARQKTLCIQKKQTCIIHTAVQMVTTELLRYECMTRSFLIYECWIKEFFCGYIVNLMKHVHSTSPDLRLVEEKLAARSSSLEESILNIVADRPESNARFIVHLIGVSHQTVRRVSKENRLYHFHFQR